MIEWRRHLLLYLLLFEVLIVLIVPNKNSPFYQNLPDCEQNSHGSSSSRITKVTTAKAILCPMIR